MFWCKFLSLGVDMGFCYRSPQESYSRILVLQYSALFEDLCFKVFKSGCCCGF